MASSCGVRRNALRWLSLIDAVQGNVPAEWPMVTGRR